MLVETITLVFILGSLSDRESEGLIRGVLVVLPGYMRRLNVYFQRAGGGRVRLEFVQLVSTDDNGRM